VIAGADPNMIDSGLLPEPPWLPAHEGRPPLPVLLNRRALIEKLIRLKRFENHSDELLLKVDPLARGAAQKYCWTMPDRAETIRFIVARRTDGAIKVVLDACQACYLNRLGYRLTKGALVCRFCGNRYSLDKLSVGIMSCRPLKLPFRIDRGLLKIRTSDLEGSSAFFPPQSDLHEMLMSALRRVVALSGGKGADAWWCRSRHGNEGADHIRQLL
jgi:Membrane iron-sulfur containing protein FtrD-like